MLNFYGNFFTLINKTASCQRWFVSVLKEGCDIENRDFCCSIWTVYCLFFCASAELLMFQELSFHLMKTKRRQWSPIWASTTHQIRSSYPQTTFVSIESTSANSQVTWFLLRVSTLTRGIDIATLSIRLSVCLSVCPWRSGTTWKRLNLLSQFFFTTR